MENVLVAQSWQPKRSMTGWGASLLLHACLALAAFGLMPKMAMVVEKEPFKWDVALVEAPREVVRQEEPAPVPQVQPPVPTPVKPRPEPVRAVPPPPQPVQRQVETRVVPQAIQREVQPVVETVRPQEQIQPTREVVQVQAKPIEPQEVQKTEPLMQAAMPAEVVRETAAAVEQTIVEAAPATAQTYQAQAVISEPTVMETRPEPVVTASAPVVHAAPAAEPAPASPAPAVEAVASVSEPAPAPPAPTAPVAAVPAPVAAAQPDPATLQEHQVVARVATPRPATKADYGWLAESLHRRIIELRHYPSTARLNGWEGKVVLKVSIRQDGQLKDVEVVKSSGHESLDQAAMEAVRRACPLHMKHELTAPMVVLHLPVSYSLNR
ncbi:MAG: TonB family protein [Nitrospira sp.]|jgi:protein TonB|uniref:energy transducer TonB n=1 Tax=Nitrospira sp. ND1 TaxID=1658518 RepID=UPI0009B95C6A|nr:energy transducer TonB [Nitrospira sp. ND1]MBK7418836.1 TonB family protein [Nitrospira sp.]MBK7485605.1 TonB family protein [Nitrospira sp.]MBK8377506.1 TonB family protein [Nitrospira sp.]MBK9998867.1 TonB family protein [Nitrospira sp.]MBP6199790.1 TonB family protein [Nitrospira sp.]